MRLLAFAAVLLTASICLADPVVEHMEPASVARGQRNRIAVVGTGVDRPLALWTTLPPGKVKVVSAQASNSQRAELELEMAADCPLGMYGLRLATEDGLSNLQLFAVDDILPRMNSEPGEKGPTSVVREFPVAISRAMRPAEVDRFTIEVQAGQRLSFEVIASRLGTDADPLITLYDAAGRQVVQRDNDPGLFFDCSFEQIFERPGTYVVEVRDSRFQGSPHWQYVLRIGNFPAARVALPSAVRPGLANVLRFPEAANVTTVFQVPLEQPAGNLYHIWRRPGDTASNWIPLLSTTNPSIVESEPNDHFEEPTEAEAVPVFCHGNFEQPGDKDYFGLDLKKGDKFFVRVDTKTIGSAADVELSIVDPTGREIQRVDDLQLPGGALDEASLTFAADRDGKYCVVVREATGASGPEYAYRIEVQKAVPRIAIVAEHSAFTVPQGSYQVLPLTVTRTDYSGPIELSLLDAPPGVKLEPTTIPDGATSLLCKLTAVADAPQGIYTLAIEAKAQAGDIAISSRVIAQPLVDKQAVNVDLIKTALRDNQRYLPPSVKDRLALQITPAIPFGVDLAEQSAILPRYLQSSLAVQTPRNAGFEAPITFTAVGQQLGEEREGRRQVFARIPDSAAMAAATVCSFHSRSQANEGKERVDITARTQVGQRQVTLIRSVNLSVQPAFELAIEPTQLTIEPGKSAKVTVNVKRLSAFNGPVTIRPTSFPGMTVPERLEIKPGQTSVEVEIAVAANCQPRRDRVRFPSTAQVGAFQEEPRQVELDLEVKLPKP